MGAATRRKPPRPADGQEPIQDGARWLYARPHGDDVAKWFIENAMLHDGMDPADWARGLTLIEEKEKHRVQLDGGQIDEKHRLVYTPFVKAEARVLYWRRWLLKHPDLVGVVEHNNVPRVPAGSIISNAHLPTGYFLHAIQDSQQTWKVCTGCSVTVSVYERDVRSGGHGRLLMQAPSDKVVFDLGPWGPNVNAIMAAQTGAIARALGFLGMLVIVGSSVATAEDVQEALIVESGRNAGVSGTATLPTGVPAHAKPAGEGEPVPDQKAYALALLARLETEKPEKHVEVQEWAKERGLNWEDLKDSQVRGVVRQLEKKLNET